MAEFLSQAQESIPADEPSPSTKEEIAKPDDSAAAPPPTENEEDTSEKKVMGAVDKFLSQFYVSKFSTQIATQYMRKIAADTTDDNDRVKKWLMRGINNIKSAPDNCSEWQRGCPAKVRRGAKR